MSHPSGPTTAVKRNAFTLVELLVAIAILALLIGLTVKGISHFRKAAYGADTQNTMMQIQSAIQTFHADNHKYPGALSNAAVGVTPLPPGSTITNISPWPTTGYGANTPITKITGTENLVLDLYGGLYLAGNVVTYDPARVGTGAGSLNANNPKKSLAYLSDQKLLNETWQGNSKEGHYKDDAGEADDSIIPELVDRFPQAMPILYLRASNGYEMPGASTTSTAITPKLNNVVTYQSTSGGAPLAGQYQLEQIVGYTGSYTGNWPTLSADTAAVPTGRSIGEQKSVIKGQTYFNAGSAIATPAAPYHGLRTVNVSGTIGNDTSASPIKGATTYQYPYDAYAYLKNPSLSTANAAATPRQKDQYILISAGPDRIYGTEDDITSFGAVGE